MLQRAILPVQSVVPVVVPPDEGKQILADAATSNNIFRLDSRGSLFCAYCDVWLAVKFARLVHTNTISKIRRRFVIVRVLQYNQWRSAIHSNAVLQLNQRKPHVRYCRCYHRPLGLHQHSAIIVPEVFISDLTVYIKLVTMYQRSIVDQFQNLQLLPAVYSRDQQAFITAIGIVLKKFAKPCTNECCQKKHRSCCAKHTHRQQTHQVHTLRSPCLAAVGSCPSTWVSSSP